MVDIGKIKEDLKKEYNDNCKKINELSYKIRLLKINKFESKLYRIYAFSILPWLLSIVFSSFAAKHNIIPLNLISPLSIGTPLLIGAVTEKILTKKSKSNELLKKFSSSKLQSKLIEEITKFEIEREKLVTLNKICEKLYSKFDLNDNKFKFIMSEKEYENSDINIIKSNINMINKQLIDKKMN